MLGLFRGAYTRCIPNYISSVNMRYAEARENDLLRYSIGDISG